MNLRLVFGILTAVSLALCLSAAEAQVIVIRAGELVDPETGTTQSDQTIVIEDGMIRAVGANPTIPADAVELDLSSLTVLPGLFDTHTHVGSAYDADNSTLLEYNVNVSTAERAIQSLVSAQSFLFNGFTTIRDLGNSGHFADAALLRFLNASAVRSRGPRPAGRTRNWVDAGMGQTGRALGPTMFISGKILAPFGGQFRLNPDQPDVGLVDYFYADTRDQLRDAIRQNIHYGATWIKIIIDDYPYLYSVEDIQFIVEESHAAGVKVAAHALTERGARHAIEGGADSIEHGYEMSDELLELTKEKGIVLVGCELAFGPDPHNELSHPNQVESIIDRLTRAYRIGVDMAYGADILRLTPGFTKGETAMGAIDAWDEAEIPAKDILRAMTVNAARLLDVADVRGAIRLGMAADIIATLENPLEDIQALKHVSFVMKDGIVYRHD